MTKTKTMAGAVLLVIAIMGMSATAATFMTIRQKAAAEEGGRGDAHADGDARRAGAVRAIRRCNNNGGPTT